MTAVSRNSTILHGGLAEYQVKVCMISVYFFEINMDICDELFSQLKGFVSAKKVERAVKMRFSIDRALTVCTETVVRLLACTDLGVKNCDIIFVEDEYGKPFLKDYPDFHFNVSHTRDALVVAVSDDEVGVDIERIRNADLKIIKRFFSNPEREYIYQHEDSNRAFYEIWTRKEAYSKFIGKGLSIDLNSFNTLDAEIYNCTRVFEQNSYFISVCGKDLQYVSFYNSDIGVFMQKHLTAGF